MRRYIVATILLLTLAGTAHAATPSDAASEVSANPDTSTTEQQPQPDPAPAPSAPTIDVGEEQEPGGDSDYYASEDLDAQRRMAIATEELVGLADSQITLTAIEIGLILIAVFAAFWAAWEARKAAKATAETVDITRETAERQLRAYMSSVLTSVHRDVHAWKAQIEWKNTGTTPARKVVICIHWQEFPNPMQDDFGFPDPPGQNIADPSTVGPGQIIYSGFVTIPGDAIENVRRDGSHIYMWGWVEYNDTFSNTGRRRTECCYEFGLETSPRTGDITGVATIPYGPFNGADEDCHHNPKT